MPAISEDKMLFVMDALRKWANDQTVYGMNVGAHVTEDQLRAAATAALVAADEFDNAKTIGA